MIIQIYLRKHIDASITEYCEAKIISQTDDTTTFTTDGYLYTDIESCWLAELASPVGVLARIEFAPQNAPRPPYTYIVTVDKSIQYTKPTKEPSASSTETNATEPKKEESV